MKKILSKISEPKRPIKSANIERAQARKIKEEGWILLEERPALIGKMVRASRTKTMVAVKIDQSKKEYSTIIVDVDRKTGEYKLDQMEDSAHEQIEEGTALKMYGMVDGVKSYWNGIVTRVEQGEELVSKSGKKHSSWVYVVHCPFEMSYVQRRTSYRIARGCTEQSKHSLKVMANSLMWRSEISQRQGLAFGYFENPSTTASPSKRPPQGF